MPSPNARINPLPNVKPMPNVKPIYVKSVTLSPILENNIDIREHLRECFF